MRIEKGASRVVFVLNSFVIKFPRLKEWRLFLNGLLANMQERQWSGHDKLLARVLFSSRTGAFLVMEKVDIVSDMESGALMMKSIKKLANKSKYKEFMLSDFKEDNWGVRSTGEFVKVDYGN